MVQSLRLGLIYSVLQCVEHSLMKLAQSIYPLSLIVTSDQSTKLQRIVHFFFRLKLSTSAFFLFNDPLSFSLFFFSLFLSFSLSFSLFLSLYFSFSLSISFLHFVYFSFSLFYLFFLSFPLFAFISLMLLPFRLFVFSSR